MRILWLSHMVPFPPKGGMLQRAYHLLRGVAERNEVTLLCFNQRALINDEASRQEAIGELSKLVRVANVIDIPCDTRPLGRHLLALQSWLTGSAYTINWLRSARYRQAVHSAIEECAPDLVHFDTISLAPYRELVRDRPCTLNHHNIESSMMARRAELERHPLKARYFRTEARRLHAYEREHGSKFALHLTCSDLDMQRLAEICPGANIAVIANGVDLEYFVPGVSGAQEQPLSLIFAGGLSWYPNVSAVRFLLDHVWPQTRVEFPAATLTIVGRNPPEWLCAAAARDTRLKVTGFVDDVRPFLDRASVYVCPIFDGGGTKLKVLDAMAMAKPLVAHPIALEGIAAQPERHWISASDGPEFQSAIRRLFNDELLRRSLGRESRQLIERSYSFAQIGAALSQSFETLAAR